MLYDGRKPEIKLSRFFLKLVKPLFCQLCDPYTSYNEGIYGITLRQLTHQSPLFFGTTANYLADRMFRYLLNA